jgi:uncharacterized protein YprB with RNaseH-like and TPR domain
MSNKQQTAVDKLIEIYWNNEGIVTLKNLEQAKEMEKEIIVNSYSKGYHDKDFSYFDFETFYNETYGGNK